MNTLKDKWKLVPTNDEDGFTREELEAIAACVRYGINSDRIGLTESTWQKIHRTILKLWQWEH